MIKRAYLLFLIAALLPTLVLAGKRDVSTEDGKEILVLEDVGEGGSFNYIKWCGNTSLLVGSARSGLERVDFEGKRTTISGSAYDRPSGCTPDGEWVLYKDRNSARIYKDMHGRVPDNIVDEGPGWHGFVLDLYRYEVSTGRRQKFAVVRDDSSGLVSPDGKRILLGNRHDSNIEMPEPVWEALWHTNDWDYLGTRWFPDSSGIVTLVWGEGPTLMVEFFSEDGWAKDFGWDLWGNQKLLHFSDMSVADKKNIHIAVLEDHIVKGLVRSKYYFYQCGLNKRDLHCKARGELDAGEDYVNNHELLPDGDFIFSTDGDDCIRRLTPGETSSRCVADTTFKDEAYFEIKLIGISPDGKWMVFRRAKTPPNPYRFYAYQYDIFVKELSYDKE